MFLIFDLDGTLFQAKPVVLHTAEIFCKKHKKSLPEERYLYKNADIFINAVLPDCLDCESVRRQYDEILQNSVRQCGSLYPGVPEMLKTLKHSGHALSLLSASGIEYIKTALEHTGIIDYFTSYHSSHGTGKPQVIKALAPKGTKAAVIGDTHGDIEAAEACSHYSIAAMYGYGNKEMLKNADCFAESPLDIVRCIKYCESVQ